MPIFRNISARKRMLIRAMWLAPIAVRQLITYNHDAGRAQRIHCMALRNGPNRSAKWPISLPKTGHFATRFGPFHKSLQANMLQCTKTTLFRCGPYRQSCVLSAVAQASVPPPVTIKGRRTKAPPLGITQHAGLMASRYATATHVCLSSPLSAHGGRPQKAWRRTYP